MEPRWCAAVVTLVLASTTVAATASGAPVIDRAAGEAVGAVGGVPDLHQPAEASPPEEPADLWPFETDEPHCRMTTERWVPKPPEEVPFPCDHRNLPFTTEGATPSPQGEAPIPSGPDLDARATASTGVRPDAAPLDGDAVRVTGDPRAPTTERPGAPSLILPALLFTLIPAAYVLYRRFTRDDILDHPSRQVVASVLEERPGATAADVARRTDLHYDTIRYHLDLLEEFDEVVRRRTDGKDRYFLNHGRHGRDEQTVLAVLADATRRTIARALLLEGGLYSGEVAERADVAPSTATHHLKRLEEAGLVSRRREGPCIRYELRPDLQGTVRSVVDADA